MFNKYCNALNDFLKSVINQSKKVTDDEWGDPTGKTRLGIRDFFIRITVFTSVMRTPIKILW